MFVKAFDRAIAALLGGNVRSADVATGAYLGLGAGLLIGYIALRDIGPIAPLFRAMVEWLLPVALFLGLLAQRRRIAIFGRIGREKDGDEYRADYGGHGTGTESGSGTEPDSDLPDSDLPNPDPDSSQ